MPEETVLIVDDEAGIVRLCERLLNRAGYRTCSATKPSEAIARLKRDKVDMLLVDIRMPEMDGFALIEESRRYQPDIGAVIMTGYGTLETAIQALRKGADGLILKPFEQGEELVRAVGDALEERRHKQEIARLRAIRPLLDMTEALFSETRYQRLLDLILNAICGHLRSSHAGIYYQDAGERRLKLLAGRGNPLSEEDSDPQGGPIGRANHWKVPVWLNLDGPGDADMQATMEEHGLGAVICTPVTRGESGLVFMAGRDRGEPGYQLADLDLFGILARQAAVALENARLYGELREYVKQVEASQRALTQAEKMAAVGRLTASIAHEVNNPLQSVQNCLHLSEREEMSPEERSEYLQMAKDELDRLMLTVRRMLDFYRPGGANREPTDLNEVMERVLKLMEKQLEEQRVEIHREVADRLPSVAVVGNQIQQVFFNLILNAMEAMPEGGELTIAGQRNGDTIEFTFEDTGPGVPPDEREKIFEPFMSNHEDGTGLGLSVSYGILTAHGGELELVPGKGSGACFRVRLPLEEAL